MRSRWAIRSLLVLGLLVLTSGCITTKAKYLVREASVYPETKADSALVFLYRTSHRAPGSDIEVYAKGKLLGVLRGGTYFHFYAEPGSLSLSAHLGGNTDATIFVPNGFNKPIDVRFRGSEMLILDFGDFLPGANGHNVPASGKVWTVTHN